MSAYRRAFAAIVSATLLATSAAQVLQFSNQTVAAGLDVRHTTSTYPFTSGGAAGDFDRDGWQDLFVLRGTGGPDGLFLNNRDGTFRNVADAAGVAAVHNGAGVAVGDIDRDGWLDVYVTSLGPAALEPGHHKLYRNLGQGVFADVADAAGVRFTTQRSGEGMSAAFGDYDLDGDLDLAVTGWIDANNGNRLFRNRGDGTFEDVTQSAFPFNLNDGTNGLSVRFADMDGDRYPELLWVADFGTSRYLVNNRDGTFSDATASAGAGIETNGMGNCIGDFDNDGRLDWYVTSIYAGTSFYTGNMLYRNVGPHQFAEIGTQAGVADGGWGWGTVAVDLDHDGWLDIVETNGWIGTIWQNEPAYVFHNQGGMTFAECAASVGLIHTRQGRGVVAFDYDNDGDQDVAIFATSDRMDLFRNDLDGPQSRSVRFFFDTSERLDLAPDGFGTRVRISAAGRPQMRYVDGGSNYLSQNELSAHFGVGDAETLDSVVVEWANGQVTARSAVPAGRTYAIRAPLPGDLDVDDDVDLVDLARLLSHWGRCEALTPGADLNADGCCDLADVHLMLANFGRIRDSSFVEAP